MLLLIDFNNLVFRTLFAKDVEIHSESPLLQLWKIMVFDSVYNAFTYNDKIDEIVLAIDAKRQWRKAYYPRYKENRKKNRDKSGLDWTFLFKVINQYIADIKHHMPFKVMQVRSAEADDIIGTLVLNLKTNCVITSNDEDYKQLISPKVKLWNPSKRKYVKCDDPKKFLTMKCLMGQSKDDIPNVKTPNDWGQTAETFDKRKPGLGPVTAEKIIAEGVDDWLEENDLKDRFKRNRILIDFEKIPHTIQDRTLDQYYDYNFPPPENMYKFFEKFEMRNYLENYHIVERMLMRLY
jgi:5'-3' exonuclease